MNYRVPSFLLTLLFLLMMTIGSLQPKTVFACAMMDMVILYECCCDGHRTDKDCVDSSCDVMLESNRGPCCERSVEISINEDTRQDSPLVKPVEIRSDVDPPQAIIVNSFDILVSPHSAAALVVHSQPIAGLSGSNTYFITQRLRI
jgi:hypothetical protein